MDDVSSPSTELATNVPAASIATAAATATRLPIVIGANVPAINSAAVNGDKSASIQ